MWCTKYRQEAAPSPPPQKPDSLEPPWVLRGGLALCVLGPGRTESLAFTWLLGTGKWRWPRCWWSTRRTSTRRERFLTPVSIHVNSHCGDVYHTPAELPAQKSHFLFSAFSSLLFGNSAKKKQQEFSSTQESHQRLNKVQTGEGVQGMWSAGYRLEGAQPEK